MPVVEVICPACGKRMTVPRDYIGKKGRCHGCGAVFPITEKINEPAGPGAGPQPDFSEIGQAVAEQAPSGQADVGEDDVLDWLSEGEAAAAQKPPAAPEAVVAARLPVGGGQVGPGKAPRPPRQPKAIKQTHPPKRFSIRLGHVDEMGAFFLFDPEVLHSDDFRSGFPQRCAVCGNRRHLSVHLVVWSSKLPGRGEFGAHTSYSRSVFELDKLGGLAGRDLLAVLKPIENLPEPYCLPFPYYLCRNCSPVGAIVPDVRLAADGHGQECELGIFSIKQAEEFVRVVGGSDCPVLKQLREATRKRRHDPWQALPLAVRSRIKQWYTPQEGEQFVTYISDGDFAKTEAGIAGVVLTDKRLVYRKFAARAEIPLTERITIEPKKKGKRSQLQISFPGGKPFLLTADEAIADRLRMGLQRQGAKTKWLAGRA